MKLRFEEDFETSLNSARQCNYKGHSAASVTFMFIFNTWRRITFTERIKLLKKQIKNKCSHRAIWQGLTQQ